jgi:hypothetical protein
MKSEEVEDTKGVIRIHKSKNRQHNEQKKKYKNPVMALNHRKKPHTVLYWRNRQYHIFVPQRRNIMDFRIIKYPKDQYKEEQINVHTKVLQIPIVKPRILILQTRPWVLLTLVL